MKQIVFALILIGSTRTTAMDHEEDDYGFAEQSGSINFNQSREILKMSSDDQLPFELSEIANHASPQFTENNPTIFDIEDIQEEFDYEQSLFAPPNFEIERQAQESPEFAMPIIPSTDSEKSKEINPQTESKKRKPIILKLINPSKRQKSEHHIEQQNIGEGLSLITDPSTTDQNTDVVPHARKASEADLEEIGRRKYNLTCSEGDWIAHGTWHHFEKNFKKHMHSDKDKDTFQKYTPVADLEPYCPECNTLFNHNTQKKYHTIQDLRDCIRVHYKNAHTDLPMEDFKEHVEEYFRIVSLPNNNNPELVEIKQRKHSVICSQKHEITASTISDLRQHLKNHVHTNDDKELLANYRPNNDLQPVCPHCTKNVFNTPHYTLSEVKRTLGLHCSSILHKNKYGPEDFYNEFIKNPQPYFYRINASDKQDINPQHDSITVQEKTLTQNIPQMLKKKTPVTLDEINQRIYTLRCSKGTPITCAKLSSLKQCFQRHLKCTGHQHSEIDKQKLDNYVNEQKLKKDLQPYCPLCKNIVANARYYTREEISCALLQHYQSKHQKKIDEFNADIEKDLLKYVHFAND